VVIAGLTVVLAQGAPRWIWPIWRRGSPEGTRGATRAAWSCRMMGMIAVVGWRYQAAVWSDVFAPQEGGIL
jgi:hypothetical protein